MDRKEFQDIVNDVIGTIKTGRGKKAVYTNRESLEVRWISGGMAGGNCWNDGGPYPVEVDEPDDDFCELDEILERVCPNISYLHFRKLEKLVTFDNTTEYEYYGNYSVYTIKRLKIEDLWDFLVEHGYGNE